MAKRAVKFLGHRKRCCLRLERATIRSHGVLWGGATLAEPKRSFASWPDNMKRINVWSSLQEHSLVRQYASHTVLVGKLRLGDALQAAMIESARTMTHK